MASGLAERKKPEHIHNPFGLCRPTTASRESAGRVAEAVRPDASGSAGAGSRRTQVLVAVRSGLPLVHEREQGGTHGREWQ